MMNVIQPRGTTRETRSEVEMIAYGPVPSRRLGRSLGINNIPPKVCSFACNYCQVGPTHDMKIERQRFHGADAVVAEVAKRIEAARESRALINYLSFVPDGEPTLDIQLGEEIARLHTLGFRVAVITNGSLLDREDVRTELALADWVSLKLDAVDAETWRRMNHPHPSLQLQQILEGFLEFRHGFKGTLVTETMLVAGVNDGGQHAARISDFLGHLRPDTAYVAVPTRPPARRGVQPADIASVLRFHQEIEARVPRAELLVGYEGDAFTSTGDSVADLLGITAVHPMREQAVAELLKRSGCGWEGVDSLLSSGQLLRSSYQGHVYYLRRPRGIETTER